ncbi:MAG: type II toxin-antitoxin system VapC family toxin [Rhizobiales bacterium]|nr:type II toxin-antitoxin system VapC family toxin [Hyphomicrobiales bacterium]
MIVLDTNVISEPLREIPNLNVRTWLDTQLADDLYLTTTSLAELQVGVAIMPHGRKRLHLEERLAALLQRLFGERFLAADRKVALMQAELVARARAKGVAINFADAQIAAIANAHGFAVASRDVAVFEAAGVEVINPWIA